MNSAVGKSDIFPGNVGQNQHIQKLFNVNVEIQLEFMFFYL